jgi:hypothetical protein
VWLAALFAIVWFLPNTQQIFASARPALGRIAPGPMAGLHWRPGMGWAIALGLAVSLPCCRSVGPVSLYFRFDGASATWRHRCARSPVAPKYLNKIVFVPPESADRLRIAALHAQKWC